MVRKLELGSGDHPKPGYEHLDFREGLPHLDYVHDLRNPLPFADNVFDEILADNVLEHFPWIQALPTLKRWVRVLKPGGLMRIIVPDLQHIIEGYIKGTGTSAISPHRKHHAESGIGVWNSKSASMIKLFGGQDYDGNYHYAAFDSELLTTLFHSAGLKNIKMTRGGGALRGEGTK